MDIKGMELYCKYIIKPIEKQKKRLEKEVRNAKFWNRAVKQKELERFQRLFKEKLVCLAEMMNDESME